MAKKTADAEKKLDALLSKLRKAHAIEQPDTPTGPTVQLILAFLQWEATTRQAETAYGKLMAELVDLNELRISLDDELIAIIGPRYPMADERIARLREALHEVYLREYDVEMHSVLDANKRDQRRYLDTLPGITPYVAAQVMLLAFGGHAVPVDEKLLDLLADADAVPEDVTDPAPAEAWLSRQIKAGDSVEAHLLFQAWSDTTKPRRKRTTRRTAAKKTTKKKTTRKKPTTTRVKKKK